MAKFIANRLSSIVTTDRVVVVLSLLTLYGREVITAITATPLGDIVAAIGPVFSGIAVFYWIGVATMYFVHLFSIQAVYDRFDIELLDRYPSFYHVFAAIATVVAQYIFITSLPREIAPGYLQTALSSHTVAVILPFFGLLVFAGLRLNNPLHDPDGIYLDIMTRFEDREDLLKVYQANDFRRFAPYLMVIVVTALYFTPLTFIGGFTAALRLYPGVLEILAIVAVVGSKILRNSRMGEDRVNIADRLEEAAAFDSPFYDVISDTPIGAGWGFIIGLFFGTLLIPLPIIMQPAVGQPPINTFLTGLDALVSESLIPTAHALEMLTRAVFWLVFTSTPYLVAVFGLWFWYQMARRAPSIIQQRAAESEAFAYDDDVDMPQVARPRGWLLPVAGLLLITFSHPAYQQIPGLAISALHSPTVQIAAWIASIGLFGWCIVATAIAEPRLPRFPTVEILLPIIVVLGTLLYAQRLWDLIPAFGIAIGVIVFVSNTERFFNWIAGPSRRSRIVRTLPAPIFFGYAGWHSQGLTGAIGYGVAAGATLIFAAEWRARNEAEESEENSKTGSGNESSG